jgi:demethylmenaquinone methyltransferase/2-methoxy-6-polyprenyl-1,4-benzoquinol methylase
MNDLMSSGLHRLWKDDLVAMVNPPRGTAAFHHLDVAGGTGDVAFRIARAGGPNVRVTVADISPEMVGEGRKRAEADGLLGRCAFSVGNAETLAFPDKSFDCYTSAFGIRNVTHIDRALSEAYRVLKPGGRFLCLEFSHVAVPALAQLYDVYSFKVLPWLGEMVAKDRASYQYLVESIRKFPTQDNLAAMMTKAGFRQVGYRNLTGGIAALHSGWRV